MSDGASVQGSDTAREVPHFVITPSRGWLRIRWRELWEGRDVCFMLALRHIQVRYKQAVLGGLWAVLQPMTAAAAFTVVFRGMVGETYHLPYLVFSYTGMLLWLLFSSTVSEGSAALVDNPHLITKVYFPRLLVPLSALGFSLLDFLLGFGILAGLMAWYRVVPGVSLLLAPLVVLGVVTCATGVSALLSALTVKYRDFKFVIPFMLQIWLFMTPVIYPVSKLPGWGQKLIAVNPLAGWLAAFRWCLLGTPLDPRQLLVSVVVTVAVLLAGLNYFRQTEDTFSDIV